MPSRLSRCLALCACTSVITALIPALSAAAAADVPFPDMARSWFRYRDSVSALHERGVITGYGDGTFKPGNAINRAEFLKIVFTARGGEPTVAGSCFSDVPEDAWYAPFVCAAARRNIVNGYPDGSFHPDQPVNVAEALKMLVRAYERETAEEPAGDKWYEPYSSFFDSADLLRRSAYLPWEPLTREKAADLIGRQIDHDQHDLNARLSKGCRAPGSLSTTLTVDGVERQYLLREPRQDESKPKALIVAFHGRTNSNERVRSYYGIDRAIPDAVIAYPAAIKNGSSYSWNGPGDPKGWVKDVAFFDAIVEHIADNTCIDLHRIYTVGHSLGAWMANSVACIRGGIVRASATVGGDGYLTDCAGPAAALMIHHQRDTLASFASAEKTRDLRLRENACGPETVPAEPSRLQCVTYSNCDGGNRITWCPHEQDIDPQGNVYSHQWPEESARTIAEFFDDIE